MRPKKKSLVFNEHSRREFLTGFHKRKLERKKKLEQKFEEQLKEAKKLIKSQARKTYKSYLNACGPLPDNSILDDQYELPLHSVRVQEITNDALVQANYWIGPNKGFITVKKKSIDENVIANDSDENRTDNMVLTSIKEIKKMIGQQSRTLMQSNKAFKKKNRLEKIKSKKKAMRQRRVLEKEKKKLKGRKRK